MAALNPTAITFDLSGISAQLSTTVGGTMGDIKTTLESGFATINQSITKLFEQLTSPQDKAEDKLDISGMREQILGRPLVKLRTSIGTNGTLQPTSRFSGLR